MTFGAAIKSGVSKSFTCSGRASRSEYWWFMLFMLLLLAVPYFGIASGWIDHRWGPALVSVVLPVWCLLMVSQCAVTARRLHDVGRSGWWQIVYGLPLPGPVVFWFWMVRRGDVGANRFGPDPLHPGTGDATFVDPPGM